MVSFFPNGQTFRQQIHQRNNLCQPSYQGKAMLASEAFSKKQFICFTRHKTTSLIAEMTWSAHKLYPLTRHCTNDTCSQSSKLQSTHINSSVFTEHPLTQGSYGLRYDGKWVCLVKWKENGPLP